MKKFLFDLFPVILFFLAFKQYDIFVATAVAMVAAVGQIAWLWFRQHQVDKMMWMNLAIIMVFGGATLVSQDETFIKWKPTVLYWLIAATLLVSSQLFSKNLIRVMLEKQIALPENIWQKLNFSWFGFFLVMGCINLYVAFNFPVDTWVSFKLFGATGLMVIFMIVQVLMLSKYVKESSTTVAGQFEPNQHESAENDNKIHKD